MSNDSFLAMFLRELGWEKIEETAGRGTEVLILETLLENMLHITLPPIASTFLIDASKAGIRAFRQWNVNERGSIIYTPKLITPNYVQMDALSVDGNPPLWIPRLETIYRSEFENPPYVNPVDYVLPPDFTFKPDIPSHYVQSEPSDYTFEPLANGFNWDTGSQTWQKFDRPVDNLYQKYRLTSGIKPFSVPISQLDDVSFVELLKQKSCMCWNCNVMCYWKEEEGYVAYCWQCNAFLFF